VDLRASLDDLEKRKFLTRASRSIAGRRLVEQENPSACATVDCKVCKRNIALYCHCISVIKSECVTNC
jgi:hypothetical protein